MALFAGLILELQMTDQVGWQELFPSKKYMATKPVPFAFVAGSSEVLQFLGVGNATRRLQSSPLTTQRISSWRRSGSGSNSARST